MNQQGDLRGRPRPRQENQQLLHLLVSDLCSATGEPAAASPAGLRSVFCYRRTSSSSSFTCWSQTCVLLQENQQLLHLLVSDLCSATGEPAAASPAGLRSVFCYRRTSSSFTRWSQTCVLQHREKWGFSHLRHVYTLTAEVLVNNALMFVSETVWTLICESSVWGRGKVTEHLHQRFTSVWDQSAVGGCVCVCVLWPEGVQLPWTYE